MDLKTPIEIPKNYKEGQEVDLLICHESDLGYNAMINNLHWGVLYKNEVFQKLLQGQKVKGYIKKVREDGKIDLNLYPTGYESTFKIGDQIMELIKKRGGVLNVNDKSSAETIYSLFGVSKKKFKIALGGLYKKRMITINDDGIKLANNQFKTQKE